METGVRERVIKAVPHIKEVEYHTHCTRSRWDLHCKKFALSIIFLIFAHAQYTYTLHHH